MIPPFGSSSRNQRPRPGAHFGGHHRRSDGPGDAVLRGAAHHLQAEETIDEGQRGGGAAPRGPTGGRLQPGRRQLSASPRVFPGGGCVGPRDDGRERRRELARSEGECSLVLEKVPRWTSIPKRFAC